MLLLAVLICVAIEFAVFSAEWYARWWNEATKRTSGATVRHRVPRGPKPRPAV